MKNEFFSAGDSDAPTDGRGRKVTIVGGTKKDLCRMLGESEDRIESLSAENKVLRAFCFSLGSEAGVSYDEVQELIDPVSTQQSILHPDCRGPWDRGQTSYPKEEHARDCDKCQEWNRRSNRHSDDNLELTPSNSRLGTKNIGESADNVGLSAEASITSGEQYTDRAVNEAPVSVQGEQRKSDASVIAPPEAGNRDSDDAQQKPTDAELLKQMADLAEKRGDWRDLDNTQQCQHLGSRTEYRSGIEECDECGERVDSQQDQSEGYPAPWIHATIHLNPESGELHSDGNHAVRDWILEKMAEGQPTQDKNTSTYQQVSGLVDTQQSCPECGGPYKHSGNPPGCGE